MVVASMRMGFTEHLLLLSGNLGRNSFGHLIHTGIFVKCQREWKKVKLNCSKCCIFAGKGDAGDSWRSDEARHMDGSYSIG
jgi:hypothetical protein